MQLYEMTVRELQTLLNNRQISAAEITDSVFGRINDVEECGHTRCSCSYPACPLSLRSN